MTPDEMEKALEAARRRMGNWTLSDVERAVLSNDEISPSFTEAILAVVDMNRALLSARASVVEDAERWRAATEGEWEVETPDPSKKRRKPSRFVECVLTTGPFAGLKAVIAQAHNPHDRDFIAAARTAVPILVAEVERLREALEWKPFDPGTMQEMGWYIVEYQGGGMQMDVWHRGRFQDIDPDPDGIRRVFRFPNPNEPATECRASWRDGECILEACPNPTPGDPSNCPRKGAK